MSLLVPPDADPATSLMLALVDSSTVPLLLLDGELHVVAASASFYSGFEANPLHTLGRLLSELGAGEWDAPSSAHSSGRQPPDSRTSKPMRWTSPAGTANHAPSCSPSTNSSMAPESRSG